MKIHRIVGPTTDLPQLDKIFHDIEGASNRDASGFAEKKNTMLRVPVGLLSQIDAIAVMANKSRNTLFCELAIVGIEQLGHHMTQEQLEAFTQAEEVAYTALGGPTEC